MQSASGSYRNLAALVDGFGGDALAEGNSTRTTLFRKLQWSEGAPVYSFE